MPATERACIIHEDVEATVASYRFGDQLVDLILIAHIRLDGNRFTPALLNRAVCSHR